MTSHMKFSSLTPSVAQMEMEIYAAESYALSL